MLELARQREALEQHDTHWYRSTETRAGDTMASLFARLGVLDNAALVAATRDPHAKRLLEGRAGKRIRSSTDERGRLLELVARLPARDSSQSLTHFTRLTLARRARRPSVAGRDRALGQRHAHGQRHDPQHAVRGHRRGRPARHGRDADRRHLRQRDRLPPRTASRRHLPRRLRNADGRRRARHVDGRRRPRAGGRVRQQGPQASTPSGIRTSRAAASTSTFRARAGAAPSSQARSSSHA